MEETLYAHSSSNEEWRHTLSQNIFLTVFSFYDFVLFNIQLIFIHIKLIHIKLIHKNSAFYHLSNLFCDKVFKIINCKADYLRCCKNFSLIHQLRKLGYCWLQSLTLWYNAIYNAVFTEILPFFKGIGGDLSSNI